jgi:transcriptional regulator PpsR
MLTRQHGIEGKEPFRNSKDVFADFNPTVTASLATLAGDISLILDNDGTIVDGTFDPKDFPEFSDWIGENLLATVTVESRPKIMEMLAAARKGRTQRWRQVNHVTSQGEIPVRYAIVGSAEGGHKIAVGRDMRDVSALQQRLLQAQQSLERDYLRLRQVETRYRMLFELSHEPVIIVEAENFRIREANPAAHNLLDAKPGSLIGSQLTGLFHRTFREPMIGFLGSVLTSRKVTPIEVELANGKRTLSLSASGFRQQGGQFVLVRFGVTDLENSQEAATALDVLETMPDAFVLVDARMVVVVANLAFIELIGAASSDQIRGRRLTEFVGRPGIDLELIGGQLTKYGFARNVATVVGASDASDGVPVELSAVATSGDEPHYGMIIRPVGRRLRDLPPTHQDLPRSVEQLTELVGRMALKDIVRESTDLIERLCIEAALTYTENNRASAAEILGLSRQSLYSKLHRYGLAGSMAEPD